MYVCVITHIDVHYLTLQITIKVMSESGNKCLLSLAESLPIAIFVDSISEAICDPHAMCRSQVYIYS